MKWLSTLLLFFSLCSYAQSVDSIKSKKHYWFDTKDKFHRNRIYVYWGYNRAMFSKSDIHFHGPGYDFTVYKVRAHDRPSKFTFKNYFHPANISVPQYNLRLGFYLKHNLHISFGIDHLKYVMDQDQVVKMSGIIDTSISTEFGGSFVNANKQLNKDFLRFEHTNGLNLVTLDISWLLPIYHTRKDWLHVGWNFGIGGIWMVTKTEVHITNFGLDNDFHIAGFSIPVHTGPRIDIWKYFFIAAEVKAGYVHLPWVLIRNNAVDLADHNFAFVEYYGVLGFSYRFMPRDKKMRN